MTEVKKTRIGLIVSISLVVILAVSIFLVYISLQSQINTLKTEKDSLNTTYQSYVSTHSHTNSEYDTLKNERDTLRAPQLHLVNFEDTIYSSVMYTDYVTVKGTIFNSGSNSATNVVLTVRLYDSDDTLIKTEQIAFLPILGKSYENFDLGYLERISGEGVKYVTTSLTYD